MTANTRRIIRLLVRFQNAVDAAQARWDDAADRDAAFDGGEFSGPACGRAFERESHAIARRFGFADADVAYAAVALLRCSNDCAFNHGEPPNLV